jgi:GH43 family beta-xylosidase
MLDCLITAVLLGGATAILAQPSTSEFATTQPANTFVNPLKRDGADPWMLYVDGEYYLSTTTAIDVRLRHAKRLVDLASAKDIVVWKDATPGRSKHIWAPEFHRLKNEVGEYRWYLYYTAAGDRDESHRMFVAESATDDILGPYTFKAQLRTDPKDEHYAIDGTVFEVGGRHYFAWCGRPSEAIQGLYISSMANPWTLSGTRTYLKADGFGCKDIREGPAFLVKDDRAFLFYSMCGASTPDYRLGMLVANANAELLDPAAWKQHDRVLLSRNDKAGVYGPGHHQFFKSPDGTEDWIVYHAKTTTRDTYGDRSTRAQRFEWDAQGYPVFAAPAAERESLVAPSGE